MIRNARKNISVVLFTALLLTACGMPAEDSALRLGKVGFQTTEFVDAVRQRPLAVNLWYPAIDTAQEHRQRGLGFQRVAENATIRGSNERFPIVLLSHGTGGNNFGQAWLVEILASHGFIVAAVNHWQNSTGNNLPEGIVRLWDRPKDMSYVLDQLLNDGFWSQYIDPTRVFAAGHSAGGFSALALVGAQYSIDAMSSHCAEHAEHRDCRLTRDFDWSTIDLSGETLPYRDERIKAVLAMSPAVGQGVSLESLEGIQVPVEIVASADDEWLPHKLNAQRYADHIPGAHMTLFEKGGHFLALPDCGFIPQLVVRLTVDDDICGLQIDADRADAHLKIAELALQLFSETGDVPASNQ